MTVMPLSDRGGPCDAYGQGSIWRNTGDLIVGREGSDNRLIVQDHALVTVGGFDGQSVSFSTEGGSSNYLCIDEGYFALYGNQVSYVTSLINADFIQIWNGSAWITATSSDIEITYYADTPIAGLEALDATGYEGLRNFTVFTSVPEPGATALAVMGIAALLIRRRRIP